MTDRINLKVDPEKYKQLKIIAAEKESNVTALINQAIDRILEENGKKI